MSSRETLLTGNDELNAEVAKLRALQGEWRRFEQQLDAAGVPYTPGRWRLQY